MASPPYDAISPFLNVSKDGRVVDSFCLDSRDSIVLGRHTNCDVLLAHPSISRHHLEVQLLHATREIRLTDMDSVHGTWIDGKQIPSLTPLTVKEGVAFKLGASSRIYKVQWLHHPLPASSNERSISPEALDSNLSDTGTMLVCSTKSDDPCTESSQMGQLQPVESLKSSDSSSDNRRSGRVLHIERRASPCCKHEVASPQITPSGGPVNGIEPFNPSIRLQLTQQQQQKGGLPPLPPVSRRIPFAPLPQNAASPTVKQKPMNAEKKLASAENPARQNAASPTVEKKPKNAEKKLANVEKKPEMEPTNKLKCEGDENVASGSRLWLRRCNSAPSPMLNTSASVLLAPAICPKLSTQASNACYVSAIKPEKEMPSLRGSLMFKTLKTVNAERIQSKDLKCSMQQAIGGEDVLERQLIVDLQDKGRNERSDQEGGADQVCSTSNHSFFDEDTVEDYPSDKENQEPDFHEGKQSRAGRRGTSSGSIDINRKPFQPLVPMLDGNFRPASPCESFIGARDDSLMARAHSRPSSVIQNLDYMLQTLKGIARSEPCREWHMVVDTTCLMDPKSFKCLKLLEGIKEVRLIIPQIVIRELDFSKQKDRGRMSSNTVLKWIESCMLKHPSWIHVQNFSENLPVSASTPPASPHHVYSASSPRGGGFGDLMSPTNGDHVLNCALVFKTAIFDGQVALLTNDTALKIKAMAEGIVCEEASSFCDSLLSPYSERFLWAGSIAHGPYWADKPCHIGTQESPSSTLLREPSKKTFMSAARGMASKKYNVVENLKKHCEQAQGLKVILRK